MLAHAQQNPQIIARWAGNHRITPTVSREASSHAASGPRRGNLGLMDTGKLLEEGLVPSAGKRAQRPGLHSLTGIRFFAALYVMLFHFGAAFTRRAHMPEAVTRFMEHGNFGVLLFFTLSGFILFYSYKDNLRTGRDLYKFFVARFARLYPVYLLAIAVEAFVQLRLPALHELIIFPMLQSWVPASSPLGYTWIIQAWSISVEFFFYCSFPVLLLFFNKRHPRPVLWTIAVAAFATIVGMQIPFAHAGMDAGTPGRSLLLPLLCLPEFLLGVTLGALFLDKKAAQPSSSSNDWITLAGILPGLCTLGLAFNPYLLSFAATWTFAWCIYRLADGEGPLSRFLSSRVLMLLGGASFSMYLLQGPMRAIMHRLFEHVHPGLDAAVSPFVLIGVSCLIFLFYEEPMRGVLRNALTAPKTAVHKPEAALQTK